MNAVTLKQLRYFCAVAETGSVTAAAHSLHVSQPALGVQIGALEKELRAGLFVRGARGVRLTEAGAAFLPHARRVLAALDEACQAVRDAGDFPVQEVALGVTPTLGRALFNDLVSGAAAGVAPFKIVPVESLSEVLLEKLRSKEIQCAFCYDAGPNRLWDASPMFQESFCLVGHPEVVVKEEVAMRELADYPLALGPRLAASRRAIEKAAAAAHTHLDVQVEIAPISLKRELLLRKRLCTIVPYGLFLADIQAGTLGAARIRPGIWRQMNLLVRRNMKAALSRELGAIAQSAVAAQIKAGALGWRKPRG